MKQAKEQSELVRAEGLDDTKPLAPWVGPLLLAHLALTRDVRQHRLWRRRIESVRHSRAVARERDATKRRLLASPRVFRRIRRTGRIAATMGMVPALFWMSWLIPMYAVGHGFGWASALAYLLPVPFAFKLSRRLWESAALSGMRDLEVAPHRPLVALQRAFKRSIGAGFAFGFSLVFLQGLISWFMTPAPTLLAELAIDTLFGIGGGMVAAVTATAMAPLALQPPPQALPEPEPTPLLDAGT
ncbi:MAG: hypothetical protein HY791_05730 [Deltaproteobacteria bacterium]|nr:hypothetical protein [Deltaproteobacteria bacterium]